MKGSADVKAIVKVKDVTIDKVIKMKGFNNFQTPPNITTVKVIKGDKESLTTKVPTIMTSASTVAIDFGQDVTFKLLYKDVAVGVGTLEKFNLKKGQFNVEPTVVISPKTPEEREKVNEMLSIYSNGERAPVTMTGFATKETVSWLAPSLANLKMATTMPPVDGKLITGIEMHPDLKKVTEVETYVGMFNALDAPVTIKYLNSTVFANGTKVGVVSTPVNIPIPPRQSVKSDKLVAEAIISGLGAMAPLLETGKGLVDVEASMELEVDGFPTIITYKQKDVNAVVNLKH